MTEQERKQSEDLLKDMKSSMGKVFRKGSELYKELIDAFGKFLEAGDKTVNPKNTYQYVHRKDGLEDIVNHYQEKNRGAVTASGRERLGYAEQIKNLLADNVHDELRNPEVAKKFYGRSFHSIQKGELMAQLHPVTLQNSDLKVPVVVDYEGEQRWFTPVGLGGNKNVAAARLGALLGIQEVTGSDRKAVMYFDNKVVEGSLQAPKGGQYIQDISRKTELGYGDPRFQKAVSNLTLLRFLTGADAGASDSLILNDEPSKEPSTNRAPLKLDLTGIQESNHTSGFDLSKKGMDISEVRVLGKSVAANLLVLTPEIMEFTLKDVLSKQQIDQVNQKLTKVKEKLGNIPVVEGEKWGEKEQKLNSLSPVYAGIVHSLGMERRASVTSDTGSEKGAADSSLQDRNRDVLKMIQDEKRSTVKTSEIPPAPPLPTKAVEPAKKVIMEAKKEETPSRGQTSSKTPDILEKNKLMTELEEKLKGLKKLEERKSIPEGECKTQQKDITAPAAAVPVKKKVTFNELTEIDNPKIRVRTQEARKREESKKKILATHL